MSRRFPEHKSKIWLTYAVLFTLFLVAVCVWIWALWPRQDILKVDFLDVGQGDAIFIETPAGYQILVDGGQGNAVLDELGGVMDSLDRTIDLIVLTHPDSDHVGGLIPVLERYEVDRILQNYLPDQQTAVYDRWNAAALAENAEIIQAYTGMRITVGQNVWLDVYVADEIEESTNNNSLVLKLVQDGDCIALLPGDIEASEESALLASGFGVSCSVLKSAHHGSKTSSSAAFLVAVDPKAIVISVGKDNKFGHPHEEVLDRYGSIPIYRTDEAGSVELKVSGDDILIDNNLVQ